MQPQTKCLIIFSKIDWIHFSAVNAVLCNPCVGRSRRIRIFFFLVINMYKRTHIYSKIYTISTKFIVYQNVPSPSNPIPYPKYLCLSIIFSQTNCSKHTIFQCWITTYKNFFYLFHKQCTCLLFFFHEYM